MITGLTWAENFDRQPFKRSSGTYLPIKKQRYLEQMPLLPNEVKEKWPT